MRWVLAVGAWAVMSVALAVVAAQHTPSGVKAQVATVCPRTGPCVPYGSTAIPLTPDGTRPPDVTATATSSATTVRPTSTATAPVAGTVCTRSTCVPAGSQ